MLGFLITFDWVAEKASDSIRKGGWRTKGNLQQAVIIDIKTTPRKEECLNNHQTSSYRLISLHRMQTTTKKRFDKGMSAFRPLWDLFQITGLKFLTMSAQKHKYVYQKHTVKEVLSSKISLCIIRAKNWMIFL